MKIIPFVVVLAAGGTGSRMQSDIPKQYLKINNKALISYSLETFLSIPEVTSIIIVSDPYFHPIFEPYLDTDKISFAEPGPRRQDSVWNGIKNLEGNPLICVHDAARPLVKVSHIRTVVETASNEGAAVLGVPLKSTIKICNANQIIESTPDRTKLWEVQTPQVIRLNLLKKGYAFVHEHNLTVTDDVSLIELIGSPVKVVQGSYENIKVTTPDDIKLMQGFFEHVHLQTHSSV